MLDGLNLIRLSDFSRDSGIPYPTLIKWGHTGFLKVLRNRGAIYLSLEDIKGLIDSRYFKKYLQLRNTPELFGSLNKLYEEYLKEREIFLKNRTPYMYCEKFEEPISSKSCPDCKKKEEEKKTIFDHTPHPIDYVERRFVKGDMVVITLIYSHVNDEEREDIMSFFDQVDED